MSDEKINIYGIMKQNTALKAEIKSLKNYYLEEKMSGKYDIDRDLTILRLKADVERLKDRLDNGIKYIENDNQYVLVWTKRELEQAKEEADRLFKLFTPLEHIEDSEQLQATPGESQEPTATEEELEPHHPLE